MKTGLYYEDIRTGEVLRCVIFTRSCYIFANVSNERLEVPKTNHYERVLSKKKIKQFGLQWESENSGKCANCLGTGEEINECWPRETCHKCKA